MGSLWEYVLAEHVFVDHNGLVRFEHAGYGGMEDFEDVVVELLQEAGNKPVEEKEQDDPKDEIHDIYGTHFYGMPPEICMATPASVALVTTRRSSQKL